MAEHMLYNAVILYGGYEFHSYLNEVSFNYAARMLDAGTFGDDTEINSPGPLIVSASSAGFWSADGGDGQPDKILFDDLGADDKLFSAFPEAAAEGARGFSFLTSRASYNPGGSWGELFRFDAEGHGRSRLLQATVLTNTTAGSSDTGTARQVGAVAANQKLYAILHVTASSGDASQTLDVKVQSDDDQGFASPTDRVTFSQVTTSVTAQYATPVSGAITDDWWRTSPRDFGWWNSWFDQYRTFAVHFAETAQKQGAEMLILGGDWIQPALPGGKLASGDPSGGGLSLRAHVSTGRRPAASGRRVGRVLGQWARGVPVRWQRRQDVRQRAVVDRE